MWYIIISNIQLMCQFFCSDAPKIFEKVVIHINGYTGDFKNTIHSSKPSWRDVHVVFLRMIFITNVNWQG